MTRCKFLAVCASVFALIFLQLNCGGGSSGSTGSEPSQPPTSPPPGFANFEPAETNPIRLSVDGTRLFAVNTPNNSLSVFDVSQPAGPSLQAEIPVGVSP